MLQDISILHTTFEDLLFHRIIESYLLDQVSPCPIQLVLSPLITQPVLVLGLPWLRCSTLYLDALNFMRFTPPTSPACQGHSRWDPFPPVCWPCHTAWYYQQTCLKPTTVYVANQDVKQHQSQCQLLRVTTCNWSPHGHQAVDHKSLSIRTIPYPLNSLSIKSIPLLFRDKDVMWDSVECFSQLQIDISCSSLTHQCYNPITKSYQICQMQFEYPLMWQFFPLLTKDWSSGSARLC